MTTRPLAAQLLSARLAAGLSQTELALRLGTSQSRVSAWERGQEAPRLEALPGIVQALGATLRWALDGAVVTVEPAPREVPLYSPDHVVDPMAYVLAKEPCDGCAFGCASCEASR